MCLFNNSVPKLCAVRVSGEQLSVGDRAERTGTTAQTKSREREANILQTSEELRAWDFEQALISISPWFSTQT